MTKKMMAQDMPGYRPRLWCVEAMVNPEIQRLYEQNAITRSENNQMADRVGGRRRLDDVARRRSFRQS